MLFFFNLINGGPHTRYNGNPNLVVLNGTSSTSSKSTKNIGIIIGGVVGGFGVLILIIVLCVVGVYLYRRNKTNVQPRQGVQKGVLN